MKVYEVDVDVNNVQVLEREDKRPEVKAALKSDGLSKKGRWVSPKIIYVKNPHTKKSDITYLGGTDGLVLNEKAKQILNDIISLNGEIYPIQVGKEKMYFADILSGVDCLDYRKSEFCYFQEPHIPENILLVEKYAFDPRKLPAESLFRIVIGGTYQKDTFTYEGVKKNPEEEFKFLVEKHKLTGLEFNLVWDSEASK